MQTLERQEVDSGRLHQAAADLAAAACEAWADGFDFGRDVAEREGLLSGACEERERKILFLVGAYFDTLIGRPGGEMEPEHHASELLSRVREDPLAERADYLYSAVCRAACRGSEVARRCLVDGSATETIRTVADQIFRRRCCGVPA